MRQVLIEGCTSTGASDAGIYVGQSEEIIVRNNKAEQNVAGIEIENSIRADVYDNVATDNSGGILVFTLPDLPKKEGRHCRVYNNRLVGNNHANFAPKGNTVATVPPGTGMMIMANDQVEVFNNSIEQNQTTGLAIVSYMITGLAIKDEKYDPFCESIHIHDNHFHSNGAAPGGSLGALWARFWELRSPTSSMTASVTRASSRAEGCPTRSRCASTTTAEPRLRTSMVPTCRLRARSPATRSRLTVT